ncbi:MAG: restriction endonuclease [Coprobacillus sp.]|nr:restriction endonuclease [Coprobacillus sp.]
MNCYNFELLVNDILNQCGFKSSKPTTKNNDGGIDIIAKVSVLGEKSIPVVVQCKEYYEDYKVTLKEMNEFIGCDKPSRAVMIYVTSNTFTEPALLRAEKENVITIDKNELITLLIKHEIGCKYDDKVNDYNLDQDYFDSLYEVDRD